eukprot:scaffold1237_cov403-Prasinococcus_capsulatus_cf.AAC.17
MALVMATPVLLYTGQHGRHKDYVADRFTRTVSIRNFRTATQNVGTAAESCHGGHEALRTCLMCPASQTRRVRGKWGRAMRRLEAGS